MDEEKMDLHILTCEGRAHHLQLLCGQMLDLVSRISLTEALGADDEGFHRGCREMGS